MYVTGVSPTYVMNGIASGIQVSKNISSVVRGWLQSPNTDIHQSVKLPSPPTISIRPERLGLGAELLPNAAKNSERSAIKAKIKKRILNIRKRKRENEELEESLVDEQNKRTDTHKILDSSDNEECSKSNIVSLRKRTKLKKIKRRKKKKRMTSVHEKDVSMGELPVENSLPFSNMDIVTEEPQSVDVENIGRKLRKQERKRKCVPSVYK